MLSKWWMYVIVIILYTLGIVHVTRTYVSERFIAKELARTELFIQTNKENEAMRSEISKLLQENLAASSRNNKQMTKELLDGILKDPVYKSCRTTDSVRNALQRKLDSQPE